jgi:hypothetical protein
MTRRLARFGAACPLALTRELSAYLELLVGAETGGAYLDVRTREPGETVMTQRFINLAERTQLLLALPAAATRADIYVGCAPRIARAGTRDAIAGAWIAWVDVDGPGGLDRLRAFDPPPTLIVASGSPGGAHGYWRLRARTPPAMIEDLNRRLAHATGGDPVWAATSILRPPATRNHKLQPPALVRIAGGNGRVYDAAALRAALPNAPLPVLRPRVARDPGTDPLLALAPRVYVARLLGVEVPGSGFVLCPFHPEQRPSFKVYETPQRGWACYSKACRRPGGRVRGGTIYDLAAAMWGVEPRGRSFLWLRERLDDLLPEARQ